MRCVGKIAAIFTCLFLAACTDKPSVFPGKVTEKVEKQFLVDPAVGKDWDTFAKKGLEYHGSNWPRPDELNADEPLKAPRCVRINNYGCVKHSIKKPYFGTKASNGYDGARDDGRHAVFTDPKFSIAAKFYWFEARYKQGFRTARLLTEKYLPWCDTSGSKLTKADEFGTEWGRTCSDGASVSAVFQGPRCQKPKNGNSNNRNRQCQACNCPDRRARAWLKGTGLSPNEELTLFDAAGTPTQLMQDIIRRNAPYEIGYKIKSSLLEEGAKVFVPTKSN